MKNTQKTAGFTPYLSPQDTKHVKLIVKHLEFPTATAAVNALADHVRHTTGEAFGSGGFLVGLSTAAFAGLMVRVACEGVPVAVLRAALQAAREYPNNRTHALAAGYAIGYEYRVKAIKAASVAGLTWVFPTDEMEYVKHRGRLLRHADLNAFVSDLVAHVIARTGHSSLKLLAKDLDLCALTLGRLLMRICTEKTEIRLLNGYIDAAESFPEARIRELCGLR